MGVAREEFENYGERNINFEDKDDKMINISGSAKV